MFRFSKRASINFQIVFFDDVAALTARDTSEGGTVTLTFETRYVANTDETGEVVRVTLPFSAWSPGGVATLVPGATIKGFGLGGQAGEVRITPSVLVDAGAVSYRLHVPDSEFVA